MKIIGNGLVARSFAPYENALPHVTIFASGVSDSGTTGDAEYQREISLLYETLHQCQAEGRTFVYFSSGGAIYGPTDLPRSEITPLYPTTRYGQHQVLCETIIQASGSEFLIVRLPNLVGESQNEHQLIPALVKQALEGKATLFRHATRDLLDVDDFARLTVNLLQKGVNREIVIIASGQSIPIETIFSYIQSALGTNARIAIIDKGDQQRFVITKLLRLLDEPFNLGEDYAQRLIARYAPSLVP